MSSTFRRLQNEVVEDSSLKETEYLINIGENIGELSKNVSDPYGSRELINTTGRLMINIAKFCEQRDLSLEKACLESVPEERRLSDYRSIFGEIAVPRSRLIKSVRDSKEESERINKKEQVLITWMIDCIQDFADSQNYDLKESIGFAWYCEDSEEGSNIDLIE